MTQDRIVDAIRSASRDNRLSCAAANALARELNVSLTEIGSICNELQIKIADCQLGCF